MTRPRRELVSLDSTPFYHCVSRCVRRAFLCGDDPATGASFEHRRQWIADRIMLLSDVFAIDVAAYAVMSNHYHLVLRIDREQALDWGPKEVIERWYRLFSGHPLTDRFLAGESLSAAERDAIDNLVGIWRDRLYDLGWFMRCLNEHIARLANAEDGCTGRFWEGRFKSQALLDEAAVLACMAYVDLNPIRAGMAETPETSEFTSLFDRIERARDTLGRKLREPKLSGSERIESPDHLLPFAGAEKPAEPDSALPFDFLDYLSLVDWTGRAIREDKRGAIPLDLAPILLRLGVEPENWLDSVRHFEGRYRCVMGPVQRLRELAESTGRKWFHGISRCLQFYRPSPA